MILYLNVNSLLYRYYANLCGLEISQRLRKTASSKLMLWPKSWVIIHRPIHRPSNAKCAVSISTMHLSATKVNNSFLIYLPNTFKLKKNILLYLTKNILAQRLHWRVTDDTLAVTRPRETLLRWLSNAYSSPPLAGTAQVEVEPVDLAAVEQQPSRRRLQAAPAITWSWER